MALTRRKRLEAQGYCGYSDKELASFTFGLRFAYVLCALLVIIGLILKSIPILLTTSFVAFLGVILPRHPFDYFYNHFVRHLVKRPSIPMRTVQSKFACGVAGFLLLFISFLFNQQYFILGYIIGGILLGSALLVTTTDVCVPSIIYNFILQKATLHGRNI